MMYISKKTTDKILTKECSFIRGYKQLTVEQQTEFEIRAMELLDYGSLLTFRKRLLGNWQKMHRKVAMQAIEDLFKDYGITDVWGV